jgi:hypothetical protein
MRTAAKLLLHVRCRVGCLPLLDIARDIERPDRRQRQATVFAPGEELAAGPRVGAPRVRVADVGGEELDIAPAGGIAGGGDQRRHHGDRIRRGRDRGRRDGCGELGERIG